MKDVDSNNGPDGKGIVLYVDDAPKIGDKLIAMAGGVLGPPRPLRMPRLNLPATRTVIMVSDKAQAINVCATLAMKSGAFGLDMEWPVSERAGEGRVATIQISTPEREYVVFHLRHIADGPQKKMLPAELWSFFLNPTPKKVGHCLSADILKLNRDCPDHAGQRIPRVFPGVIELRKIALPRLGKLRSRGRVKMRSLVELGMETLGKELPTEGHLRRPPDGHWKRLTKQWCTMLREMRMQRGSFTNAC